MVTVEEKEIIRREHSIRGKSIRQIAREPRHSRRTIRKAIMDAGIPAYTRKKPVPKPVLGPHIPIIKQWLEEDRGRPVKQYHTAKSIYDQRYCGIQTGVR